MNQFPPPAPVSQKSYWVMLSPSVSVAVNRLEAAKVWPVLATSEFVFQVLTGAPSAAVKPGVHALHCDH